METWRTGKRGITPGNHSDWDAFVRIETERFLARYQSIEIMVRPGDTGETVPAHAHAYVHVPYMMGTVTWVDQPETLARQRPRHRARLRRVKQAREDAPPEIRAFLQRWFYDQDGGEKLVAKGRSNPEDIRQLLQAAVNEGLVPIPTSQGTRSASQDRLTGKDLRAWLQRYGIGVDRSAFVQHSLTHLLQMSYSIVKSIPANPPKNSVNPAKIGGTK